MGELEKVRQWYLEHCAPLEKELIQKRDEFLPMLASALQKDYNMPEEQARGLVARMAEDRTLSMDHVWHSCVYTAPVAVAFNWRPHPADKSGA